MGHVGLVEMLGQRRGEGLMVDESQYPYGPPAILRFFSERSQDQVEVYLAEPSAHLTPVGASVMVGGPAAQPVEDEADHQPYRPPAEQPKQAIDERRHLPNSTGPQPESCNPAVRRCKTPSYELPR